MSPRVVTGRLAALVAACLLAAVGCGRNHEPEAPDAPRGPEVAAPQFRYLFTARTADPDEDDLSFRFDWGDGEISGWYGPVPADSLAMAAHTWTDTGRYEVRTEARDEHLQTSGWSEARTIVVTRDREVAPDFALPAVDGSAVQLYPLLANGPVFIVWWDLPCVNCISEIESLLPLRDTLAPRGFELLALSVDKPEDNSRVRSFAASRGWRCPVLFDSARTAATAYGLSIKPTGILVGTDTTIVYTLYGYARGDREAVRMQVLQWLP